VSASTDIDLKHTLQKISGEQPDNVPALIDANAEINWKLVLGLGFNNNNEVSINAERAWSAMANDLRTLCPETEWLFIRNEKTGTEDAGHIKALHDWLRKLVTVAEWPFPKQAIFMSEIKDKKRSWKLIIPGLHKRLPYHKTPRGLSLTPFRDKYSGGWKITPELTFITNKAGEA